jgi:hypothetical protein
MSGSHEQISESDDDTNNLNPIIVHTIITVQLTETKGAVVVVIVW